MGMHTPPELRRLWGTGKLTSEQAIGHVIQNLLSFFERLADIEKRLRRLEEPPLKAQE